MLFVLKTKIMMEDNERQGILTDVTENVLTKRLKDGRFHCIFILFCLRN